MLTTNNEIGKAKNKAFKIVDRAIKRAEKERDEKGYRENLGYDQYNEVKEKVEELGLEYGDVCDIMNYFDRKCDNI